jgi:LysM repeat protein
MQRVMFMFGALWLMLGLSACNLGNQADDGIATIAPTTTGIADNSATNDDATNDNATNGNTTNNSADAPTDVPEANTNEPTAIPCTIPNNWQEGYEVQRGDTLTSIAQSLGMTVTELATGNCLANPNALRAGQMLFVPPNTDISAGDGFPDGDTSMLNPWYATGDTSTEFPLPCLDYAQTVPMGIPTSRDIATNIQQALGAMLATPRTFQNGNDTVSNSWGEQGLSVTSVILDEGLLEVNIAGEAILTGVCEDARMRAQMLLTVFHNPVVTSARIIIGGRNMAQIFDMSGQSTSETLYTRDDIGLGQ